ncbi:MAG: hypothetical protein FJ117_08505 [Deltaproteobacteria bacterium]|nr:hypothetical protein [Deltaproteobacteria bacterium]
MDRRIFIKSIFAALAVGGISILPTCSKKEGPARLGNQEKLWKIASGGEKIEEPLDLSYAKDTPAIFRDASMGKEDPNFKPKTGGG